MTLIFEKSVPGRQAKGLAPEIDNAMQTELPTDSLRQDIPRLPEMSELETLRHYTQLSQKNFSIDGMFYPLGSCTMKYNPRIAHNLALLPGFAKRHPLAEQQHSQGFMRIAYELQTMLSNITGMVDTSLSPMAGAQGELAGVYMIKAYHQAKGENRTEMLVPDSAHGTNPASAVMCGFKVKEIRTAKDGDIDMEDLESKISENTAGIMLTNPSTLGLFERKICQVAELIHAKGGLLYYDGANLNALLGKVKPGDMGFDVMHMNLHKTFATPHGGGGPGCGPVAVAKCLQPFLPTPRVGKGEQGYHWLTKTDCPQSIGRFSTFMGNAGIIIRAYIYIRLLGREGLPRVAEHATLNANYLMTRLGEAGFDLAYNRRASHEFVLTFKNENKNLGVNAMDFAKRLLDYRIHAPTTYFPLLIPECWLIEPTETESKQVLDRFVDVLTTIKQEAETNPDQLRNAPFSLPVKRLDDVKAARELDLVTL